MADNDANPVAATTGTYAALKLPVDMRSAGGNAQPANGKILPPAPAEPESPDMEQLANKLNAASQSIGRDLRFEVDMQTGHAVIQVLDRETGEIIRQIPPEHARTYVSNSGVVSLRLFDEQV